MAEQIMNEIESILTREQWTRAALNAFSVNGFKELDAKLDRAYEEDVSLKVMELCNDQLEHNRNSIAALYLSGIIAIKKRQIDDANLLSLIKKFSNADRWPNVEYLCEKMLSFGENRYALRILAECHEKEGREKEKYEVWERLIRIDYEEIEIAKLLGEKKEQEGNTEEAVQFYTKAFQRSLNSASHSRIKEFWTKLIELNPDEIHFFYHAERKVGRIDKEWAVELLELLLAVYQEKEQWVRVVEILKRIITYNGGTPRIRKEIVDAYRNLYSDHDHVEEYIALSNLAQHWRNPVEAIADFEKHISFKTGNFVSHKSWGVGVIREIKGDMVVIDFSKKRNHEMALKMAVNALQSISKNHIYVLKGFVSREKLRNRIKKDVPWALETMVHSFGENADFKRFKSELVPSLLTESEWSSWGQEARKLVKTNSRFGYHPDKTDRIIVREKPIPLEEKLYNAFKGENDFFKRLSIATEYIEQIDGDSDYFIEMFQYFNSVLKNLTINETTVASFLFIRHITINYPFLKRDDTPGFLSIYEKLEKPGESYAAITSLQLREDLLQQIIDNVANWTDELVRLFPYEPNEKIIDALHGNGRDDLVAAIVDDTFKASKERRYPFFWLIKNCSGKSWFAELGIPEERIWINLIRLLDLTFRDIENKKDAIENRKINRGILSMLFKEEHLERYLLERADADAALRIFALVQDIKHLDPAIKHNLRQKIIGRFPKIVLPGEYVSDSVGVSSTHTLLVTADAMDMKKKQLKHLLEVEIPNNSKEIGAAIELGDLSENAEYKAGKEKQENLNIQVGKLKDEIERARIMNPEEIDITRTSFGTRIYLTETDTGKSEEYIILGPWESDPGNNIISYLSPLATELIGSTADEVLDFEINDRHFQYKVEKIEAYL